MSEGFKAEAHSSSDEIDITYDTEDEETEEQIIEKRRERREQLLKVNNVQLFIYALLICFLSSALLLFLAPRRK